MKRNCSKQDSFLTGSHPHVNKEEVKFKSRSISIRSKDTSPPSTRGTYRSVQNDENKSKKKKFRKKDGYPTGFREVFPSANYDEVKQTVKNNIKVAPKQKETIPPKSKLKRNSNTDFKDNDKSDANQPSTEKLVSLKTDNEMPSCTTVYQDALKSALADLCYLGSLYNQETVKLPHVLDNNNSSMKMNYKGNDKDIEQLVYFLHEYMGNKYLMESYSKQQTDIEKFSPNAKLKNLIFSFLLNLPVKNVSETSPNGMNSTIVQQAVIHSNSSSKSIMTLGQNSKDTLPSDKNNDDEDSQEKTTESYEIEEIKSSKSENSQSAGSLSDESLSDKSSESLVGVDNPQEQHGGISSRNESSNKMDKTEKSSSTINNPEKSSDELKNSQKQGSQSKSQSSMQSDKSKETQGGKSDSQTKGSSSNIGGSETKSGSKTDNSEKSHSNIDNTEKSSSKTDNTESKSPTPVSEKESEASQGEGQEKEDDKASQGEGQEKEEDEASQGEGQEKEDDEASKGEGQEKEDTEGDKVDEESAEAQDENGGEGEDGGSNADDTSWLQTFQERVDKFLSRLNFIRGPLLNDSVLHGYSYLQAVKGSLGQENPDQNNPDQNK